MQQINVNFSIYRLTIKSIVCQEHSKVGRNSSVHRCDSSNILSNLTIAKTKTFLKLRYNSIRFSLNHTTNSITSLYNPLKNCFKVFTGTPDLSESGTLPLRHFCCSRSLLPSCQLLRLLCFPFWHLASPLFWSLLPRHLDKSSLSVPVCLSTLVSRHPPPPPPLCVCFGHNVTAPCPLCVRMGPLS